MIFVKIVTSSVIKKFNLIIFKMFSVIYIEHTSMMILQYQVFIQNI